MRKMRGIMSDRRLCPPHPPLPTYCCQTVSQQEASAAFAAYPANILRSGQQMLQQPRAETQLVGNRSGGEDGEDNEGKTPAVYNSTKNKREYNINI